MTDILAFNQAIGEAYALDLHADRAGAVAHLREAIKEPAQREAATQRLAAVGQVVKARTQGGRCGCHISQVTYDLLKEALDA